MIHSALVLDRDELLYQTFELTDYCIIKFRYYYEEVTFIIISVCALFAEH